MDVQTSADDIDPDGKDWTWVLERPCSECGFDATAVRRSDIAGLIRSNASEWEQFFDSGADLLTRPPQRWSALEYACHVRDVHKLYLERLNLMLAEDNPLYPNWDQDQSAVDDGYQSQDPAVVRSELGAAANAVAEAFEVLPDGAWQRKGRRSDGAVFTVGTFARYFIHDPIHHLHDVIGGQHSAVRSSE